MGLGNMDLGLKEFHPYFRRARDRLRALGFDLEMERVRRSEGGDVRWLVWAKTGSPTGHGLVVSAMQAEGTENEIRSYLLGVDQVLAVISAT